MNQEHVMMSSTVPAATTAKRRQAAALVSAADVLHRDSVGVLLAISAVVSLLELLRTIPSDPIPKSSLAFASAAICNFNYLQAVRPETERHSKMGQAKKVSSALSKLFVYGALKYGQPSNSILASSGNGFAKFWCKATTTQKLPLVIATRYNIPFLLNKPGVGYYVTGEIYEVDNRMLNSLDNLEDCEEIYTREMHDMNIGVGEGTVPCWVYLLQKYPENLLSLRYLSSYENSTTHPYIMRHRRTHKHPAQDDLTYEAQN